MTVWVWMQNNNCHSAITSGKGFGAIIKAINNGLQQSKPSKMGNATMETVAK